MSVNSMEVYKRRSDLMIYYQNGKWHLHKYKMDYKERGEDLERYVTDVSFWEDFENKWEHFKIDKYEESEYTEEQLNRFTEIEHFPEDFGDRYSQYVINGDIDTTDIPKNHLFNILKLEKEKVTLENSVMELTSFVAGGLSV